MREIVFENRDCMEAMKEFPDKFFDLAIVDPPYGIGVQSMNFTKSGARRPWGNGAAFRTDYRRTEEWDIKPGKEYFDELFRVSKAQIVWGGGIISQIICRRLTALSYGISVVKTICATTLLTASTHG